MDGGGGGEGFGVRVLKRAMKRRKREKREKVRCWGVVVVVVVDMAIDWFGGKVSHTHSSLLIPTLDTVTITVCVRERERGL